MTALVLRLRRFALALALLGVAAFGQAQDKAALATIIEIGLVHVNDVYQISPIDAKPARGGLARLAGLVETLRREHPATLFVFGGDTLSPGVESGMLKGAQMMRAWNAMRLDLAVPGNHEFDFGAELARERFGESRFPWLAANIHAEPPLPMLKASELREIAASGVVDLILGGHEHYLITELAGRTPISKAGSDARGETLRRGESNIANYAADAVRAAPGADIALLNAGGFRSDQMLGPGPLTRRDIVALLPFQNPLPVSRAAEGSPLETEVLLQAMERAGSIYPRTDGRLRALR